MSSRTTLKRASSAIRGLDHLLEKDLNIRQNDDEDPVSLSPGHGWMIQDETITGLQIQHTKSKSADDVSKKRVIVHESRLFSSAQADRSSLPGSPKWDLVGFANEDRMPDLDMSRQKLDKLSEAVARMIKLSNIPLSFNNRLGVSKRKAETPLELEIAKKRQLWDAAFVA